VLFRLCEIGLAATAHRDEAERGNEAGQGECKHLHRNLAGGFRRVSAR